MLRRSLRCFGLAALAWGLAAAPAQALDCFAICDINTACGTSCFNAPTWTTCGAYNSLNCGGGDSGPTCPFVPYLNQDVRRRVLDIYYIHNVDGRDYWGCSLEILNRQWESNSCYGNLRGQCHWKWEHVVVADNPTYCYNWELDNGLPCEP